MVTMMVMVMVVMMMMMVVVVMVVMIVMVLVKVVVMVMAMTMVIQKDFLSRIFFDNFGCRSLQQRGSIRRAGKNQKEQKRYCKRLKKMVQI